MAKGTQCELEAGLRVEAASPGNWLDVGILRPRLDPVNKGVNDLQKSPGTLRCNKHQTKVHSLPKLQLGEVLMAGRDSCCYLSLCQLFSIIEIQFTVQEALNPCTSDDCVGRC